MAWELIQNFKEAMWLQIFLSLEWGYIQVNLA